MDLIQAHRKPVVDTNVVCPVQGLKEDPDLVSQSQQVLNYKKGQNQRRRVT